MTELNPSGGSGKRREGVAVRGAAIAAGIALAVPGAGVAVAETTGPDVRLSLPEPTGKYQVGVTEMRLVDDERGDQWGAEGPREFMVSVWYPAAPKRGDDKAGYMAQEVGSGFLEDKGLPSEGVDWEGTPVHAYADAPVDRRAGKSPVVLYGPGAGSPRGFGTTLVDELASQGYVVVTMDHTGEAPVRFPDGHVEPPRIDTSDPQLYTKLMVDRVADSRFVLDRLEAIEAHRGNGKVAADVDGKRLPRGLGRIIDTSEVGMFGHSLGGAAGAHTMHADERVDAAVDMDGSIIFSRPESGFEERFPVADEGLDRPFMFLGGSGQDGPDAPVEPHTHRTFEDWGRLWENSTGWKRDINFPESRHFSFTDVQVTAHQLQDALGIPDDRIEGSIGTSEDPGRVHESQRAYVTAFFDQHLRGEPRGILDGESPDHPDAAFIE